MRRNRQGSCVFAESRDPTGRWLVVWPPGFRIDDTSIVDGAGNRVTAIGATVGLTGGEYHHSQYDFLKTLLIGDIGPECRTAEYWLATVVS